MRDVWSRWISDSISTVSRRGERDRESETLEGEGGERKELEVNTHTHLDSCECGVSRPVTQICARPYFNSILMVSKWVQQDAGHGSCLLEVVSAVGGHPVLEKLLNAVRLRECV